MKNIVCFHLFNDYSGSPKVLRTVLDGLLKRNAKVTLVSSRGGVLDEINNTGLSRKNTYTYSFSPKAAVTMLKYTLVQLWTFLTAFRFMFKRNTVFFINTILPVGPALAGRIMGKKVVYHYHENAFAKSAFYRVLAGSMQKLANEIICVSHYQASFLKRRKNISVVHNALPTTFVTGLKPDSENAFNKQNVLMVSSLKDYKGTREFISLAHELPQFRFTIVINDTPENIEHYLSTNKISCPDNLKLYPRQDNVTTFYNDASIVLNLTNKDMAIETFGLTALEALAAGVPVIVPTVGGVTEFVTHGENGFLIDVQNLPEIKQTIVNLLSDRTLYTTIAANALKSAGKFSEEKMIESIAQILQLPLKK